VHLRLGMGPERVRRAEHVYASVPLPGDGLEQGPSQDSRCPETAGVLPGQLHRMREGSEADGEQQ
jgi:hypothetical protein